MKITEPEQIDHAVYAYHIHLARSIMERIGGPNPRRIVEIGSGPGTFTIPLLETINGNFDRFYCVDSYKGDYADSRKVLDEMLSKIGLARTVDVLTKEAQELHLVARDMNLVIGHEVLCDLDMDGVSGVMKASLDSLHPGGRFVHSQLSPHWESKAERLMIEMNRDHSTGPVSKEKWFSPTADTLGSIAHRVGFKTVEVEYLRIPFRAAGEAAVEMARRWKIEDTFIDDYMDELKDPGIEYPLEQIIYLRK